MTARVLLRVSLLSLVVSISLFAQNMNTDQATSMTSGTITGSVRTLDGRPLANARVEARDIDTGSMSATTYTNERGMFELYNIRRGNYEIVAISGVDEAHERVQVGPMDVPVNLRINARGKAPDGSATVSVARFKVPEKAQKEYEKGAEAFKKNKLDEAHKHIDKALSIYPNYAEALVIRGLLSVDANNMAAGEADLQAAIKADPSYGMGYIAMGAVLNQERKFADAKRVLQRGVALAPDSWQAYFELSKAAMGMSEYDAALKNVERAHGIVKNDYPPIHLIKAHALMGLKQYEHAVAELEQFLARDPQNPNAEYARNTLDRAKAFLATNNTASK